MILSELIGSFGRYQYCLATLIFANKFGMTFHHMAIIFLAPPVSYQCPHNASCCEDPVYDRSIFTRTIVTEWHLICSREWMRNMSQMMFQFGVLIGSLTFGIASDRYGRRKTLISAAVLEVVLGIGAAFMTDYWSFTVVRLLLGGSVGGVMVVGFVILMEYVGSELRSLLASIYHIPFNLGHIFLALVAYLVRDYVYFQLTISLANVVLLLYICFLPESPRWLLAMNRTDDAIQLVTNVAKRNGLPTDQIADKLQMLQDLHAPRKGSFLDLFRTPNLRRNIIIMSFNWLVCCYCFYGVSQYISHLTGNIFINVVAEGIVCLIATLLSIVLMKFMGRKPIVMSCHLGCSVSLFLIAFTPQGMASVILGCLAVLFSFIVFVVVYLYCTEMFPTVVRNGALGISSMMARVGAMVAPFVAMLGPFGQWCAPVAFGVMPLIALVLCIWLPETKGCELITTIEEGEALGHARGTRDAVDGE